jgi:hypothetical protein
LVLLYGASGVGKTSLLLAGARPRLERADPAYETLYVRALDDPDRFIRDEVTRRLPETELPKDGSLVAFLDVATRAMDRTLVIVLDQFEEFFVRFSRKFRESFIGQLGRLYDARDVPVKVVFSLREDWLASMSEIEERVPGIYRNKMRLLPLTRAQALQAMVAPVKPLGMSYEPALVERLFEELVGEYEETGIDEESATVMPPQLQLVCDALYERARAGNRKRITVADYEAVGGARDILGRYIEEGLREHPGEERDVAKGVLQALVTSQATRASTDVESITAEVGVEEPIVKNVLSRLIAQRLVRRLDEGQTYELAHDILAASIAHWIGEEDRQLKRVREMLRRELADWRQDPKVTLSQGKFQRISSVRDSLKLGDEGTAFLLRAAVLYDEEVGYWLEQVSAPDAQAEILLEMLGSETDQARLAAARYLVALPQDHVAMALAHSALEDPEPAVRDMGAVSLGRMEGQPGIKLLTDAVSAGESLQRTRAVRALALIQDVAPETLSGMQGPIRRQVYAKLAKIRFWRTWPRNRMVTAAGAIGGAVGFGLGMAPPMFLHETALYGGTGSIADLVFIATLLAAFGLLAGTVMAFGVSVGESLFSERIRVGRIVGGTLLGGAGFAAALAPLGLADAQGLLNAVLRIVGGGLFGMMIGVGTTVPEAIGRHRAVVLGGGVVGAAPGIVLWGALGFKPLQIGGFVSAPVLLASGGLVGLIMAFSIAWAEARWPTEKGYQGVRQALGTQDNGNRQEQKATA